MQKGFKREYPDLQEHLERLKKYDLLYTIDDEIKIRTDIFTPLSDGVTSQTLKHATEKDFISQTLLTATAGNIREIVMSALRQQRAMIKSTLLL